MDEMNRKRLEVLRAQYPVGCIVVLVSMDGQFAPPKGTRGEILSIDDTGTIHVIWKGKYILIEFQPMGANEGAWVQIDTYGCK